MKNSRFQIPDSRLNPPTPTSPFDKGGQRGILKRGKGGLYAFIVLCCLFFSLDVKAEPRVPEKLTYSVYWSGIKAGSASLEVENTPEGIRIMSRATSAPVISIFYKVEDIAQSILYPDGYPSSYTLKISEGKHRRDKTTLFGTKSDKEPQKVMYSNKLENETMKFNLEKQTFDPLSGFYAIRKRQLVVGQSEFIDIFDSKKLWSVEVQILRKQHISTPAGEFDTIVVKPLLQSEGIFMKKGEIYIWLTDDEQKVPVMMKSKVKIGSIIAKLVEGAY